MAEKNALLRFCKTKSGKGVVILPKSRKVSSDKVFLSKESQVKLKTAGNIREVVFSAGVNKKCPIQNISKEKYVDKKTGEIKEKTETV